jgi:hypothetical protein
MVQQLKHQVVQHTTADGLAGTTADGLAEQ